MDYIKFTIEVAEKNHSISAGMAKEQYDTLRAERDEAMKKIECALQWLQHYPSQDDIEEQTEHNRQRAIKILSGQIKVKP